MITSESIAKIAEAMAAVQKGMQPALKDSDNPFFKSKYADLASVSAACKDLMAANGIAVIQSPGECADKQMSLTTRLIHKSGEWIEGTLSIPLPKFDPQAYGSALTYARRYSLAAFAGVVTDDDDGNAATRPSGNAVANDAAKSNAPITEAQFAKITVLGEQIQQDWQAFCKHFNIKSVKELPASKFADVQSLLMTKIRKQEKEAA